MSTPISTCPRIGPFMGVQNQKKVTYKNNRTLLFVLYAAYNACGLIGSEFNGIAILDEDNKCVICDNLAREDSGYFGATSKQVKEFERITNLQWEDVRTVANNSSRSRCDL